MIDKENCVSISEAGAKASTGGNKNCSKKGTSDEKLLRCSRCKNMQYDSRSCQRDDRKRHKGAYCLVLCYVFDCHYSVYLML